ncbi:HAD-IA family hydrolase [bacterium]|nr:HAD-IA family hydrolase [bacterium]
MLAIFDHDGVLVDSLDFHTQAWIELGRRENLPIDAEFVRQTFGLTNFMIFERLFGGALPHEQALALGNAKEQCYRDIARGQIELMAGVRDLIENLSSHDFGLAIGSSGPRPNLFLTIESCGLDGRFRSVVGLEDIRRGKPDPEVFLKAADQAGVDPRQCVVFEDAVFGVEAAKAAGMYAVAVGTTNPLEALLDAGADIAVPTLENFPVADLAQILRGR